MAEIAMTATAVASPPESVTPASRTAYITKLAEEGGFLRFTLANVDISVANSIRRTILADIPTLCFKVFPHKDCEATIHKNTSRFNNEILKQRLGCIPIHIADLSLPHQELLVEVQMENLGKDIIYLTTEDFKIKNTKTDKYIAEDTVRKIFPPDPKTGEYILFARLRPRVSNEVPGEIIHIEARMSLHTAVEDGMYNVVSCCSYAYSPDPLRQDTEWQKFKANLTPEETEAEALGLIQQDWYNREAKRIFKSNQFDFIVETVGVFTNSDIVRKACQILVSRLRTLGKQKGIAIQKGANGSSLSYEIILENEGYTIGKLLEASLYQTVYVEQKLISYISFIKKHPHDTKSTIRIVLKDTQRFEEEADHSPFVLSILETACKQVANILVEIEKELE